MLSILYNNMEGYIYKITNKCNSKIYIGQTKNIKKRFTRHINDSINNILDTHLSRAIRKYGKENFSIEQIDTASTQDELNKKENYYINKYNCLIEGYNETDSIYRCGGNTYSRKSVDELNIIKEKIRKTKIGDKNPNSVKVKMTDIKTNKEKIFSCMKECQDYLSLSNHSAISKRCRNLIKKPLFGKYNFEYYKG